MYGDFMKKGIRVADGIFALLLTFIYTFIISGSINLPDKMVVRDRKSVV